MKSNDVKFKLIPLTKEEYISLKKEAYKLVDKFREYSLKEKYNFLKSLKFKDSTSYKIFISTLILPNDAEILKEKDKIKLISVFSKKTGLSTKILRNLVLFKIAEYKIVAKSGILGPKRMEGDLQVPEGFYYIDRFNPASSY